MKTRRLIAYARQITKEIKGKSPRRILPHIDRNIKTERGRVIVGAAIASVGLAGYAYQGLKGFHVGMTVVATIVFLSGLACVIDSAQEWTYQRVKREWLRKLIDRKT